MTTRRTALQILAAGAASLATGLPALAQDASPSDLADAAGPLGDIVQGAADAKVTVVEYASMTCSHCANFHKTTYQELKKRYVETGKARYILREFPLDPLAVAAAMLIRTQGDRFYEVAEDFFLKQADWAFTNKPLDALRAMALQAGITVEVFEATLKDEKLYQGVLESRKIATERFKVNSTPTVFINGKRFAGGFTAETLDETLRPMLQG